MIDSLDKRVKDYNSLVERVERLDQTVDTLDQRMKRFEKYHYTEQVWVGYEEVF